MSMKGDRAMTKERAKTVWGTVLTVGFIVADVALAVYLLVLLPAGEEPPLQELSSPVAMWHPQ
jgi:hypothetical protein